MAEQRYRVDHADALGAVGDIDRAVEVVEKQADDFAETERDNRQIVTAFQRWRARGSRRTGRRAWRPAAATTQIGTCNAQAGKYAARCGELSSE